MGQGPYQPPEASLQADAEEPRLDLVPPGLGPVEVTWRALRWYVGSIPVVIVAVLLVTILLIALAIMVPLSWWKDVNLLLHLGLTPLIVPALLHRALVREAGARPSLQASLLQGAKCWSKSLAGRLVVWSPMLVWSLMPSIDVLQGVLFLISPFLMIYLGVRFALTDAVALLEPGERVLARSARLTRGRWWRTFLCLAPCVLLICGLVVLWHEIIDVFMVAMVFLGERGNDSAIQIWLDLSYAPWGDIVLGPIILLVYPLLPLSTLALYLTFRREESGQ